MTERQGIDEVEPLGNLEPGDACLAGILELFRRRVHPLVQDHERHHLFAPVFMRRADDRGLRDGVMGEQHAPRMASWAAPGRLRSPENMQRGIVISINSRRITTEGRTGFPLVTGWIPALAIRHVAIRPGLDTC